MFFQVWFRPGSYTKIKNLLNSLEGVKYKKDSEVSEDIEVKLSRIMDLKVTCAERSLAVKKGDTLRLHQSGIDPHDVHLEIQYSVISQFYEALMREPG